MTSHCIAATRVSLIFLAAAFSASVHAADGTIQIRGAVVEPACSVSTTAFGVGHDAWQRVSQARDGAGMPLQLSMQCNARQAIQLTMIQPDSKTRAGFDTGIAGVRMLMQYEGRAVVPGEAIWISLPQRMTQQIRIETRLEADTGNLPGVRPVPPQARDGGRMLVAIDYI